MVAHHKSQIDIENPNFLANAINHHQSWMIYICMETRHECLSTDTVPMAVIGQNRPIVQLGEVRTGNQTLPSEGPT